MSRPFIPVPDTASLELIYVYGALVFENVLHVKKASPFSLADLQTLRGLANTWDTDTWASRRHAAITLNRIRTKALDTTSSPMEDYALPTPRAGGFGGYLMALNVTFCVKLASAQAGRSQRGRLYFPGISTTMTSDVNVMAASQANAIVAALNTLRDRLIAATPSMKLVVVSYRADKTWRAEGQTTDITQAVYVDLNLDAQRRRLTGRGRT